MTASIIAQLMLVMGLSRYMVIEANVPEQKATIKMAKAAQRVGSVF
jgi:hypothetical protein